MLVFINVSTFPPLPPLQSDIFFFLIRKIVGVVVEVVNLAKDLQFRFVILIERVHDEAICIQMTEESYF